MHVFTAFLLLMVMLLNSIRPAYAVDINDFCLTNLHAESELTPGDLYNVLARYTPATGKDIQSLFDIADRSAGARTELNQKLVQNSYLKKMADRGLGYRHELMSFLQNDFYLPTFKNKMDLQGIVLPEGQFKREFKIFLKTLNEKIEKPMTEAQAERLAWAETSTMFQLDPNVAAQDLSLNPIIQHYYIRQKNRHLLREIEIKNQGASQNQKRFQFWLNQEILLYQNRALENLVGILLNIAEFEGMLRYHRLLSKDGSSTLEKFLTRKLDAKQLKEMNVTITESAEFPHLFDSDKNSFVSNSSFWQQFKDNFGLKVVHEIRKDVSKIKNENLVFNQSNAYLNFSSTTEKISFSFS